VPPRWHHVVVAAGEWTNNDHVKRYLAHADTFPHRAEGESVLLDHVPLAARRILDLGTGDGRLLALLRVDRPGSVGVGVDVSEPMLERARERFAGEPVEVLGHDLAEPLPEPGGFDAVVSCFAIHHLEDDRKRSLYAEVFAGVEPGQRWSAFEFFLQGSADLVVVDAEPASVLDKLACDGGEVIGGRPRSCGMCDVVGDDHAAARSGAHQPGGLQLGVGALHGAWRESQVAG